MDNESRPKTLKNKTKTNKKTCESKSKVKV